MLVLYRPLRVSFRDQVAEKVFGCIHRDDGLALGIGNDLMGLLSFQEILWSFLLEGLSGLVKVISDEIHSFLQSSLVLGKGNRWLLGRSWLRS